MEEKLDKEKDSPSDYAILLRNVSRLEITDNKTIK